MSDPYDDDVFDFVSFDFEDLDDLDESAEFLQPDDASVDDSSSDSIRSANFDEGSSQDDSVSRARMLVLSDELAIACEQALGYQFKDRRKLEHSLTHSSIARTRLDSNERLEFLGDAIMGAVVCEHLYHTYSDLPEGELTRIKSAVVSRHTCANVSKKMDLGQYLLLGKGLSVRERIPSSILAAAFEAVVAGVFLDGGYAAAQQFIMRSLLEEIEKVARSAHAQNFKSMLQQMAQKIFSQTPVYRMLDEKGPDHSKCFQISAAVGSRVFPAAWGPSKKEAEQNAARNALEEILESNRGILD
jgi:ribonuclease-3